MYVFRTKSIQRQVQILNTLQSEKADEVSVTWFLKWVLKKK